MIDLTLIFVNVVNIMILVLQGVYVLFAFMLSRQLKVMSRNFMTSYAPIFSFLALINFWGAVLVVVITFFVR